MPSEALESSLDFIVYLIVGLTILSSAAPLQRFYSVCESVEAKKVLEILVDVGGRLEENMCATVLLERPTFSGRTVFKSWKGEASVVFEDGVSYSMVCPGVEFYEQEVELHDRVVLSKVGGRVRVESP